MQTVPANSRPCLHKEISAQRAFAKSSSQLLKGRFGNSLSPSSYGCQFLVGAPSLFLQPETTVALLVLTYYSTILHGESFVLTVL